MRALLLAALSVVAVQAQVTLEGRRCATPEPTVTEVMESMRVVERARMEGLVSDLRVGGAGPATIPVAFHVMTAEAGRGDVPDERIQAQLDTLNTAFAPLGYRFALALVQRVENPEWYDSLRLDSPEEAAMKQALARDPSRFLNVYSASLALDFLGWAFLPGAGSEQFTEGGVVLLDESLPGGSAAPYNLGHTGTHEVGHWAGLLHTFSGGCAEPNDGVADTPQERSGASGCPTNRDSCPLDPGNDPVNNFMDYSDDACMTQFTDGQTSRARALLSQFRPTLATGGFAVATLPLGAFDETFVGLTTTADLRVTNADDAPFTVSAVTSDGVEVSVEGLPATVAPGEVAVLGLSLSPPADGGAFEATLSVVTDGPSGTIAVPLSGRSVRPPTARLPVAVVDAALIDGEAPVTRTLTLANDGDGPLSFAIDPTTFPSWIAEAAPLTGTVAPQDSVVLSFVFEPALGPGDFAETLGLVTNDPVQGTVPLALSMEVLVRPSRLALGAAYPNPGSGIVTIPIELPDDTEDIEIAVFDTQGRLVAVVGDGVALPVGYPEARWDASSVPAGLYLVRVTTPTAEETTRVVIAR